MGVAKKFLFRTVYSPASPGGCFSFFMPPLQHVAFKGLESGHPIPRGAGDRVRRPGSRPSSLLLGASQAARSGCPSPDGGTGVRVGSAAFAQYGRWGRGWGGKAHCRLGCFLRRPGPSPPAPLPFGGCPSAQPVRGEEEGGFAEAGLRLGIFPEVPGWRNNISAPGTGLGLGRAASPTHPSPSPDSCVTH